MSFRTWLRSWKPATRTRTARPRKPAAPRRMYVESLEDRLAPAVILWDGGPGGFGGDWHAPVNWVGDVLPGPNDEAQIGAAFSAVTITAAANVTVNSVTSAGLLRVTAGTFSVAAAASANRFELSGGTLAGAGTFTIASQFSWSGGDMTTNAGRTVLAAGVTGTITGTTIPKRLGRVLDNGGSLTYSGSYLGFGPVASSVGVFNNLAGASFTATGDGDLTPWYSSTSHAFNNLGTFTRLGAGDTVISGAAFNSSGPVAVQAGALALNDGGIHTAAGDFAVAAGATLQLGGNHTLPAGADITGNGSLRLASGTSTYQGSLNTAGDLILQGGTLTVAGSVTVANITTATGTVIVNGAATATAITISGGGVTLNGNAATGSFTQSNGTLAGTATLTVASQFSWSGGDMVTNAGRTVLAAGVTGTITGTTIPKRLGRVLDNGGSLTYSGSYFGFGPVVNSVGVFNNLAGASFTATGDGDLTPWYASSGHAFNNLGTFVRTGAGDTDISGAAFNSSGPVSVNAGTLALNGGGTHTASGDFAIAAGATLQLGGNHTLPAGSDIGGNGSLRVASGTSTYQGSLSTAGDLILAGGTLTVAGSVSVANLRATGGTVIVNGPVSAAAITITGGGVTHNAAAVTGSFTQSGGTLAGAGTLTIASQFSWSGGDMATNAGRTVLAAGVTGAITGTTIPKRLGRVLDNGGNVTYSGSYLGFGPIVNSVGVFNNLAGASFTAVGDGDVTPWYASAGHAFNNLGTFTRLGAGDTVISGAGFSNSGTAIVHEGTLRLDGGFANFSGTTLTGGSYTLRGTFQFAAADIRTNAAAIELDGPSARIVNQVSADALANFAANAAAGRLTLRNGFTLITAGAFSNAGAVTVAAGSLFAAVGNYTQTAGTTTLSGFGGMYAADTVNLQGGLLTGDGYVYGNVVNAARIDVGGTGTAGALYVLGGNYTQTAGGVLNVDLGGPEIGTQYDFLYVEGTASLAGTLNVSRLGGYLPNPNDYFLPLLSGGLTSGAFGTITGLPLGGGRELLPYYFDNGLLLYVM